MTDPALPSSDPRGESKPMLPDDWQVLAPLVDAVLDAPPERRAAVLAEVSAGDAARSAAIERLVAECEHDAPMLNRPAAERFARLLAGDDEMEVPATLGGRYHIERELGRGGMARVYLARDTKHERHVAVKVIRPDLAASLGRDRFLREIGIAARLRHPNIVPLYDSGDADGLLYFVMPYEEGPSLRERLSGGQRLPVAECVSALRDVARALVYAHEHGLVHRDVKPDNVMMSGGAAVVTDFGIAKAVSAATTGAIAGTLTQAGAGIGTPAYMAPEQAIGDPSTDHRADIYSFGCLAYELFAGHPPFHGLPSHQIIAAHVGTKPVPLSEAGTEVPDAVARLVGRCLEKNPAQRPQSAQEVLAELEGSQAGPNESVRRRRPVAAFLVPLLIAGALVLGVTTYMFSRARVSSARRAPGELTLAVLPLRSLGGDSLQGGMAEGLSDEVASALFKVPGVRIMSRPTVGKYSGQRVYDPQKTGKELGARLLVMGSLRGSNDRFTATVRLVDANDGSDVWADVFERSDGDYSAVREAIVQGIAQTLRTTFGTPADTRSVVQQPSRAVNPEAYRLYLVAQAALNRRGQSVRASADLFRQATRVDTLYAKAYSGLSLALAISPHFQPTPSRDVAAEVTSAAQRALRLDPTLAQPHIALGFVYSHANDWDRAGAEFQTAVALDGRDVEARLQYGRHLMYRDRFAEALQQLLAARAEDPASAVVSSWVSYVYFLRGQMDSALVESDRAFQNDSSNITTLGFAARIRLTTGRLAEARALTRRLPDRNWTALYVLAALGDTATAMQRVHKMESERPKAWMTETARAMVLLGARDSTGALAALERATDANEIWPSLNSVRDPIYDPIRASARFHRLLQRVGLPMSLTTPRGPR